MPPSKRQRGRTPSRDSRGGATTPVNTRWFQHTLAENKISQRKLAALMHVDAATVTRLLKGERRLQASEAAALARILNVPLEDVMSHAGIRSDDVATGESKVPVVGWIGGRSEVHYGPVKGPRKVAASPGTHIEGLEALRYQTAQTPLDTLDGAVVYYRPVDTIPVEAIGKLCVIRLRDGNAVLAVPRRGYKAGLFNLSDFMTGAVTENVWIESASPVLWMKL